MVLKQEGKIPNKNNVVVPTGFEPVFEYRCCPESPLTTPT